MSSNKLSRRRLVQLGAASAVAAGFSSFLGSSRRAHGADPLREVAPKDRKLLFVFCAHGGASIIDSYLPIVESEVGDAALANTLNVFPERLIGQHPGKNLRYVKLLDSYSFYARPPEMGDLVARHGEDMVVMAHDVSSVNHAVGQQRSLNGDGVNRGRTIMEAAAMRYGGGMPLPSCNMSVDGYLRHGAEPTLPQEARHEIIATPLLFAAGTHGYRGIPDVPDAASIDRARAVRAKLDQRSVFGQTFKHSTRRARYLHARDQLGPALEHADVINKLLLLDASQIDAKYGLEPSPLVGSLRETLPLLDVDDAQAQVGLGFLMAYYGISASVTIGHKPNPVVLPDGKIVGTPLAFDFSHNLHRVVQSIMWGRTASLLDQLIMLLKSHDYLGDPALGKMWDRSLIYVATEFGRDKIRPSEAASWGTSHHLNNGSLLISPLLKGNAVYGGVDPKTGLTYGFDPSSGEPDTKRVLFERDVYSVIAHALDIEFPGRIDFPALVRT
jgi:hypothetical protein